MHWRLEILRKMAQDIKNPVVNPLNQEPSKRKAPTDEQLLEEIDNEDLQEAIKKNNPPVQEKRPLTEWEDSIRTRERMEEDWKKYPSILNSLAAYGLIAHFYDKWKNAPPPPTSKLQQPHYTFEFIYHKVIESKSPGAAIAFARFVNDNNIPAQAEIGLLWYLVSNSGMNAINYMFAAPPFDRALEGMGYKITEYLRVLDQTKFDNVVKLLHKYENAMPKSVPIIYGAIATAYIESVGDEWNNILSSSSLDLSRLALHIYRKWERGSSSDKVATFLHTFIDRISSDSVKKLFYASIDNDHETGEYIFKEFFPKKPDIDRTEVIISAMSSPTDEEGINHYTLGSLVKLLNATEVKKLEEEYLGQKVDSDNIFVAMLGNIHSNKPLLYSSISKRGPDYARRILSSFIGDETTKEEKERLDVPVMQKIIEKSNDPHDITSLIRAKEEIKTINFASAKKRYNDIIGKGYIADPLSLQHEKDLILKYFDFNRLGTEFVNDWINIALDKKDWFYLDQDFIRSFFYNQPMEMYIKYKPNAASSIYHDIKGNYDNVMSMRKSAHTIQIYRTELNRIVADKAFNSAFVTKAQNFSQYVRSAERLADTLGIMHNTEISDNVARKIILNPAINLKDKTVEEFIELIGEIVHMDILATESRDPGYVKDDTLEAYLQRKMQDMVKVNANLIDPKLFFHNLEIFNHMKQQFDSGEGIKFVRGTPEYVAIKQLHTQLKLIEQFHTIREYIQEAKPKDKRMFELNWDHPSGLKFNVMGYLDPAAFSIGAETDCCQRIGGAGEEAAIDSFINPMASVLVLSYGDKIIGQSYFHIVNVPQGGIGIILDNVERNDSNMKSVGLTENALTRAYADWAAAVKQKNDNVSYVLSGKGYSKINNHMFNDGTKMKEDPREFAVDDPYSDFDEDDHLDLLKPRANLEAVSVSPHAQKHASVAPRGITKAMVRSMFLTRGIDALDRFSIL